MVTTGRCWEIETLAVQAAGRLWELVKTEGDLKTHLRALRDYFLMGKGDFWQDFLVEVRRPLLYWLHQGGPASVHYYFPRDG